MHTYIHTYTIRTYIHTYTHTYIHTYYTGVPGLSSPNQPEPIPKGVWCGNKPHLVSKLITYSHLHTTYQANLASTMLTFSHLRISYQSHLGSTMITYSHWLLSRTCTAVINRTWPPRCLITRTCTPVALALGLHAAYLLALAHHWPIALGMYTSLLHSGTNLGYVPVAVWY